MSPRYAITPAAAHRDPRLSLSARALLSLLGTYTERNGWCHPKQTELAAALGVRREYISRTLRILVELGYVETRSFTAARRGRVALEYRVRTDLPDDMVQAVDNSRCEPDVRDSAQRPAKPLKLADVLQGAQRPDVNSSAHRYIESSLREDKLYSKNKHFPENFVEAWERWPQRGRSSKAKSSEAWAKANKAHAPAAVLGAFDAYLASPDARRDNGQYVPALERWLRDKLETWIELAAGRPAELIDWSQREANFHEHGDWNPRWGKRPDEPGYQRGGR